MRVPHLSAVGQVPDAWLLGDAFICEVSRRRDNSIATSLLRHIQRAIGALQKLLQCVVRPGHDPRDTDT